MTLHAGLFFSLTAQSLFAETNNVKIGVYYSPWYVSGSEDCFYINETPLTNTTMEKLIKEGKTYVYYFQQTNAAEYISDPIAYSNWFHAKFDRLAYDNTLIPIDVWPEDLATIYGSFEGAPIPYPDDPWDRVRGVISLKQQWVDAKAIDPGAIPFIPTNFVAYPNPLRIENGGFGFYEAEDCDVVIQQKKLAAEYGIDYFAMEWYWSYDSSKDETVRVKTAPLNTFFFETPPEKNLKLAVNWVISQNWNAVSNPHAQDFTSNTVSKLLEKLSPYLLNSQYLYIDNKPALFIFDAEILIDRSTNYVERFQQLKTEVQNIYGLPGITLISMFCDAGYEQKFLDAGFDYIVNRGPSSDTTLNYDQYRSTLVSVLSNNNARCNNIKSIPSVLNAHHPEDIMKLGSALYRQHQEQIIHGGDQWGNLPTEYPNLDIINGTTPSKFRNALNDAINFADGLNQTEQSVMIWSWNGWGEGTVLEPTTSYGYKLIDAIQERFSGAALQFDRPTPGLPDFSDNFNDNNTLEWNLAGADWSAFSKALYVTNPAAGGLAASVTSLQATNSIITCDLSLFNTNGIGWAGIHFRKKNVNDTPFQSGYVARMHDDGRLALFKVSNTVAVVQTDIDPASETFRLHVEISGVDIKVYLNGTKYIDYIDTDITTYDSGYIGLACHKTIARFDNFEYCMIPKMTYFDNFNDNNPDGWSLEGAYWTVFSKGLYMTNSSLGGFSASPTGLQYTNETVSCDLNILTTNGVGWAGIHFRKTNQHDSPFQSGYVARMHDDGRVGLYMVPNTLAVAQTGIDPTSEIFRLQVKTDGTNIKIYVNETEYIDYDDPTYSSGYFGLACHKAATRFDNFTIE